MKILHTKEACFTRMGITNLDNCIVKYSDVKPHLLTPRHFQHNFKIKDSIGIIDWYLIVRYFTEFTKW